MLQSLPYILTVHFNYQSTWTTWLKLHSKKYCFRLEIIFSK